MQENEKRVHCASLLELEKERKSRINAKEANDTAMEPQHYGMKCKNYNHGLNDSSIC